MLHVTRPVWFERTNLELAKKSVCRSWIKSAVEVALYDRRNIRVCVPKGDKAVRADNPDPPYARTGPKAEAAMDPATFPGLLGKIQGSQ